MDDDTADFRAPIARLLDVQPEQIASIRPSYRLTDVDNAAYKLEFVVKLHRPEQVRQRRGPLPRDARFKP